MTDVNVKMDLIKLDMVVKDIYHLWSEVPSSYVFPKAVLAESRSVLRSNVGKSLKLAQKSHKLFQTESAVATRYNLIADDIPKAGEVARHQNALYQQYIAEGKYDQASESVERLISIVSKSDCIDPHISVELISSDGNGCMLLFTNSGDGSISVMNMTVTSGSEKVKTDPRNTFTIPAKASRKVTVSSPSPVHVSLQYIDHGETKSFDMEMQS